ncbi:hypothetical protein, partial [Microseira wollei]|uniref:hypothetical protein n=1 Tax=Microseira wollei TaxID=467598 RepID=UPI001CFC90BB
MPRPMIHIHSRFDIKVGARHQSGWLPAINSSLAVPLPIIQIHSRFDIKVGARHQSGWLPAINSSLAVPRPIIHIKFGRLP